LPYRLLLLDGCAFMRYILLDTADTNLVAPRNNVTRHAPVESTLMFFPAAKNCNALRHEELKRYRYRFVISVK
jgi:hypothetical protein